MNSPIVVAVSSSTGAAVGSAMFTSTGVGSGLWSGTGWFCGALALEVMIWRHG